MYEDYSIDENLFHWQSQSTVSPESNTGQRYINHRKTGDRALLQFAVKNTCNALSPLYSVRDMIDGFEVIQGSMDNVFLNVCGREKE